MKRVVSGLAQMLNVAEQNSTSGTTFHFATSGKKENYHWSDDEENESFPSAKIDLSGYVY